MIKISEITFQIIELINKTKSNMLCVEKLVFPSFLPQSHLITIGGGVTRSGRSVHLNISAHHLLVHSWTQKQVDHRECTKKCAQKIIFVAHIRHEYRNSLVSNYM